jgi:hypothetical protein
MRRIITRLAVVLPLLTGTGCSSQPALYTRTYKLPQGDVSWEAIGLVLNHQWQQHDVLGQYGRREGDAAVVCTSADGHRKIQASIEPQ